MKDKPTGESAVEHAAEWIRNGIRSGHFAPGQRLVAGDLMKFTGVSAGPVREAVRKLSGEGLLQILPHRGAIVSELSREDVIEIYQLREVIEGMGAYLAAARIDIAQNRKNFTDAYSAMRAAFEKGDISLYNECNHRFHDTILNMSGNVRLQKLAERLFLPIYMLHYHSLLDAATMEISAKEHDQIAQAIIDGDANLAEKMMRRHVRTSAEVILDGLAEAAAEGTPA